jgi:hypothetical protein
VTSAACMTGHVGIGRNSETARSSALHPVLCCTQCCRGDLPVVCGGLFA